jgi:hypothetical protein
VVAFVTPGKSTSSSVFVQAALQKRRGSLFFTIVFKNNIGRLLTRNINGKYNKKSRNARKYRCIYYTQVAHATNAKARIKDGFRVPIRSDRAAA